MINNDELTAGFNEAGLDTKDKLTAYLSKGAIQLEIQQLQAENIGLNAKEQEATADMRARRIEIQARLAELNAQLNPG